MRQFSDSTPNRDRLGRCVILLFFVLGSLASCVSGVDQDMRNREFFSEAAGLTQVDFTTAQPDFGGNIQALATAITNRVDNNEATCAATTGCSAVETIEGIVTMPAAYGIDAADTGTGCTASNSFINARSFVLQDANAGILVAYGLEPPSQNTADSASAKYILNARKADMAVFGDRLRITVTRVRKYGDGTNFIPVVTDFNVSTASVVSSRNKIPYAPLTVQFGRAADLFRVRQIEGYVKTAPKYVECSSGRSFQYNYQRGYIGVLCVGATSASDANTCSGAGKVPMKFQMSLYLGAGTLSGFDVGNKFSYTLAAGAKVRMRGPVFPPERAAPDVNAGDETTGNLLLMLGQRLQVETIK